MDPKDFEASWLLLKQLLIKYTIDRVQVANCLFLQVASPPSDGISGMEFSSQADYLAMSSWDNQVSPFHGCLW